MKEIQIVASNKTLFPGLNPGQLSKKLLIMRDEIEKIVDEGLSHISTQSAEIAKREIVRKINSLVESYTKDLKHFKDTNVGLWVTDKKPKNTNNFFRLE